MAAKTSTRPLHSWAALAQALLAAPTRWVVGAPDDRRRMRRYANASATPRSRRARAPEEAPREGVSYFVPNLRFYLLLATVFGTVFGGLTGGVLGATLAANGIGSAAPRSVSAPGRPVLQASVGQALQIDGLKLAVVATEITPATSAGQAQVRITLAYARGADQERPGLWTADGAWSVSAADFGVVSGEATTPLTTLQDSTGATRSWLEAGGPAGWVTLTAQVPCGTFGRLEYDPAPFAQGARLQFALPAAVCLSS